MSDKGYLDIIGIMTGNSMDAADLVLTRFYDDGRIEDIDSLSVSYPSELYQQFSDLRVCIQDCAGQMKIVQQEFRSHYSKTLDDLHEEYIDFVAEAVRGLIAKVPDVDVDLIGFHGQTCAHQPPSAGRGEVYTVQIGNGQSLANKVGVQTVYDFRSDDILAGGEGAPFAPMHHKHLALHLGDEVAWPVLFVNGGNTSNFSFVYRDSDDVHVLGWDCGPCNHYTDLLCRKERNILFDENGEIGQRGNVNESLLRVLYDRASLTAKGSNFLDLLPPKSSDPQWYQWMTELDDTSLSFEDRLHTAQYFAAYQTYLSLRFIPDDISMPRSVLLFGGGWQNPVMFEAFKMLISGDVGCVILPEHQELHDALQGRLLDSGVPDVQYSHVCGIDDRMMEARIFADMARCKVKGIPFTVPEITGALTPVVCGVVSFVDNPVCDLVYSRASLV